MRRVLPFAAAAVLVAGVALTARGSGVTGDILAVPPPGGVSAEVLADGTPVFVVHAAGVGGGERDVMVVEAVAGLDGTPLSALVGWCEEAELFIEPHLGAVYLPDGRRSPYPTSGNRRNPNTVFAVDVDDPGLARREVLGLASRGTAVRVGGRQEPRTDPDSAIEEVADLLTPFDRPRFPPGCQGQPQPWTLNPSPATPAGDLRTHAAFAQPFTMPPDGGVLPDGPHLLAAAVVRDAGGATLCAAPDPARAPDCPPDAPAVAGIPGTDVAGIATTLRGPLLVTVADGDVRQVALLPTARWSGAGFDRLVVFDALLADFILSTGLASLRLLEPEPTRLPGLGDGLHCLVPSLNNVLTLDVSVDATVTGRQVMAGSQAPTSIAATGLAGAIAGPQTPRVEVVADPSTCRVLRLAELPG